MKRRSALHIILALLLAGCTDNLKLANSKQGDGRDTIYTEAAAMNIHLSEPDRAMVMIDSAVAVGNITWLRGQYLKAITQYGGYNNFAQARQTCLDLLALPNAELSTDTFTLENIYKLLVTIEYTTANNAALIRYATEASRLAHTLQQPDLIGEMEGYIAFVMASEGKTDEGISHMLKTIDELWQMKTFNSMIASYNTSGHLQHILLDHKRYSEMVELCEQTLKNVDEFVQHTDHFADTPEDFDPKEFEDFARGQTLAFMTTAYARQYTSAEGGEVAPTVRALLIKKAREAEAEMFKTKWSKTIDCDRMMTAAYHHLGEFQRFDEAMARLDAVDEKDTISYNFLTRLGLRSTAAQMRGRLAEAISYMDRLHVIRDSLDKRNQRNQLNELATVYHLQEEQLARQQKEAEAERSHIINIVLAIGLIATAVVLAWFFRQKRIMEKKNRVLAREITENADYREKYERIIRQTTNAQNTQNAQTTNTLNAQTTNNLNDQTTNALNDQTENPDETLYQQLSDCIIEEQLFLDPLLDRQALVDRFSLPKERIGAAFAKGSPYKSLIDFLTDCRLHHAIKLLAEKPELSIAEVAQDSGFSSADTFGRNFRQKYALTPSQYRKQQGLC